jgi:hypothetical protein
VSEREGRIEGVSDREKVIVDQVGSLRSRYVSAQQDHDPSAV